MASKHDSPTRGRLAFCHAGVVTNVTIDSTSLWARCPWLSPVTLVTCCGNCGTYDEGRYDSICPASVRGRGGGPGIAAACSKNSAFGSKLVRILPAPPSVLAQERFDVVIVDGESNAEVISLLRETRLSRLNDATLAVAVVPAQESDSRTVFAGRQFRPLQAGGVRPGAEQPARGARA